VKGGSTEHNSKAVPSASAERCVSTRTNLVPFYLWQVRTRDLPCHRSSMEMHLKKFQARTTTNVYKLSPMIGKDK
jgi:hypothetical protein